MMLSGHNSPYNHIVLAEVSYIAVQLQHTSKSCIRFQNGQYSRNSPQFPCVLVWGHQSAYIYCRDI